MLVAIFMSTLHFVKLVISDFWWKKQVFGAVWSDWRRCKYPTDRADRGSFFSRFPGGWHPRSATQLRDPVVRFEHSQLCI